MICEQCGNPIEDRPAGCPFCGALPIASDASPHQRLSLVIKSNPRTLWIRRAYYTVYILIVVSTLLFGFLMKSNAIGAKLSSARESQHVTLYAAYLVLTMAFSLGEDIKVSRRVRAIFGNKALQVLMVILLAVIISMSIGSERNVRLVYRAWTRKWIYTDEYILNSAALYLRGLQVSNVLYAVMVLVYIPLHKHLQFAATVGYLLKRLVGKRGK